MTREQSKEAEIVRLPTPARTIWIDWSTGQLCVPEPIEHGGHVIPFTAPRRGLRGKGRKSANIYASLGFIRGILDKSYWWRHESSH